jgi:hypothetical protein
MSWVWHDKKLSHDEPDWDAPVGDSTVARLQYLYSWERRCRGYAVHPFAVALEPAFIPYERSAPLIQQQRVGQQASSLPAGRRSLRHLSLLFPMEQKVTPASAGHFLQALSGMHRPISFEVVASPEEISYQFSVDSSVSNGVMAAAQMLWPRAFIEPQDDALGAALITHGAQSCGPSGRSATKSNANNNGANNNRANKKGASNMSVPFTHSFVVDFGLTHFAYLPLACFGSFNHDPLAGVVAGLGQVQPGELAGMQVLFMPAGARWKESLLNVAAEFESPEASSSRYGGRGSRFRSLYESDTMQAARAKLSHPLYAAVVRVFAVSTAGQSRAFEVCRKAGSALGAFTDTGGSGNGLLALSNDEGALAASTNSYGDNGAVAVYPDVAHLQDVLERTSHRTGMLLSLPELAGLVHPPSETLHHPKLLRLDPRAQSLPDYLLNTHGTLLGLHPYRKAAQPLVWPDSYRNRHAYVLGATRMGKSTLLLNMICHDMAAGRGLCLIDPHGDLALDVLAQVPPQRSNDTIYLNLSDLEFPLALGLLEANDEYEQRLLCSDLLSVLKRLFASSWGDRLEHILRHAILTLLSVSLSNGKDDPNAPQNSIYTLRDIRPLLSNKSFRERVIQELPDPELKAFWTHEFLGYTSSAFSPLYNKLGQIISTPLVRNIVAQRKSM